MDPLIIAIIAALVTQVVSAIIMVSFSRGKEIKENTKAVVKLSTQMEHIYKAIEDFPKYKRDVDFAHKKIREMQDGPTN